MSIILLAKVSKVKVSTMESFKERLKELREEAGISMQQLANAIGVSNAAVCKWENGIAEPKVCYLIRLADYFNCTADFLIGRTDDLGEVVTPQVTHTPKIGASELKLITKYKAISDPNVKKLVDAILDEAAKFN